MNSDNSKINLFKPALHSVIRDTICTCLELTTVGLVKYSHPKKYQPNETETNCCSIKDWHRGVKLYEGYKCLSNNTETAARLADINYLILNGYTWKEIGLLLMLD